MIAILWEQLWEIERFGKISGELLKFQVLLWKKFGLQYLRYTPCNIHFRVKSHCMVKSEANLAMLAFCTYSWITESQLFFIFSPDKFYSWKQNKFLYHHYHYSACRLSESTKEVQNRGIFFQQNTFKLYPEFRGGWKGRKTDRLSTIQTGRPKSQSPMGSPTVLKKTK